jgi:RNA polymerase sigma factor (sigma-70 family)
VSSGSFRQLDDLAARLPFAVDDYAAAGEAFARWQRSEAEEDLACVHLWTYCYVLRYVLTRFLRERTSVPSDVDEVMSECHERILNNLHTVREPARYASFVSVICKRALLNHRARRRDMVEPEDHVLPQAETERTDLDAYDAALVLKVIQEVIDELPDAIRPIAHMRLIDKMEYEQIAEITGRPIATVRTYVSKAFGHLRADPRVRALYYDTE